MIRTGAIAIFAGVFIAALCACGDDPTTGDDTIEPPPPPERSAIETCIAGGGSLVELWSTSNVHGPVRSIAVTGQTIVLGSDDGSVKQWNLGGFSPNATYGTVFTDEGPAPVGGLAVSGDDRLLAVDATGKLAEWRLSTAQWVKTTDVIPGALSAVAVGGGRAAVAIGLDSPVIRTVDRAGGTVSAPLTTLLWGVSSLAFAYDGRLFTAGHFYATPMVERRASDAPGTVTDQWGDTTLTAKIQAIALDAAATTLVAAGDGFVAVLAADDLAAGPSALTLAPDHQAVGVVLLSGNELFVTAGREGTLQLWRAATGEHLATLPIATPIGVGVDAHGEHLFTAGPDGNLHAFGCR